MDDRTLCFYDMFQHSLVAFKVKHILFLFFPFAVADATTCASSVAGKGSLQEAANCHVVPTLKQLIL